MKSRFAPSPTGDLHVGGAFVALASWVLARRAGGVFVVRVEDLDPPRVVPGAVDRILDDLAWLGLAWDLGPRVSSPDDAFFQSRRTPAYVEALSVLERAGYTYPCDCSRAEIARVASAPHAGEELVYPGTCRDRDPARPMKRPPATRFRVPEGERGRVSFVDGAFGARDERVGAAAGDFVLRRGDGVFAYQLAVTVDDLAEGITCVVRGADLLGSTARQILLARLLGGTPPAYVHVPLVVGADGERLAKRTRGARIRGLREAGVAREAIVGELAFALGLTESAAPVPLAALSASDAAVVHWPTTSFVIPQAWSGEAVRLP